MEQGIATSLLCQHEFHSMTGNNEQVAKMGDVVEIHNDSPRIQWRLGEIEQLNKDGDGLVRSAQFS